jgi:hypothetical protein
MRDKFSKYNLQLEEVLIGTPKAAVGDIQIENILTQLRERQIAEEKKVTYQKQQSAAESEKSLREAEAIAAQQSFLTKSNIQIEIDRNAGAALQKGEQEANQIIALAKATTRYRLEGEAESFKESKWSCKGQAIDARLRLRRSSFRVFRKLPTSSTRSDHKVTSSEDGCQNGGNQEERGSGPVSLRLKFIHLIARRFMPISPRQVPLTRNSAAAPAAAKPAQGYRTEGIKNNIHLSMGPVLIHRTAFCAVRGMRSADIGGFIRYDLAIIRVEDAAVFLFG